MSKIHILAVCNPGQYKNQTSNKCEDCPSGTFQPRPGQEQCLACPEGSRTVGSDTFRFTSCRGK